MSTQPNQWTKSELKTYILLFCANIDDDETKEELDFIKSRTTPGDFNKMYKELLTHSEQTSIDKIDENIQFHEFTDMELIEFRTEIRQIFNSDNSIHRKEGTLDRILDNILY
jgi:hypothetical protein